MDRRSCKAAIRRMQAVPPINLLGNILAALITFFWFAVIVAGLHESGSSEIFWERLEFFVTVLACLFVIIVPINVRWFVPLIRSLRKIGETDRRDLDRQQTKQELNALAGRIMDLPIKLAFTSSE